MDERQFHETTKRRAPTRAERLTPCQCCGWPLSQRHHLLSVATYGENSATVQLCANCHELYHLMYNHFVLKSKGRLLGQVLLRIGLGKESTTKIYQLVEHASQIEKAMDIRIAEAVMQCNTK